MKKVKRKERIKEGDTKRDIKDMKIRKEKGHEIGKEISKEKGR